MADDDAKNKESKKRRRGLLRRLWTALFPPRSGDYEKRLQHLSKKENAVHERLARRARASKRLLANLLVLSVIAEVVAVICAIMTTRSLDLSWQMRAVRVLPMFVLPGLSYVLYSTFVSFTRMLDQKDRRALEKLRSERQEKIDELKESTNYYRMLQLIQKYDLDPAAKAAAATVLASKLGAETGLKVHDGDESKTDAPLARSSDIKVVHSDGLRNRNRSHVRGNSIGGNITPNSVNEALTESRANWNAAGQSPKFVEHHQGPARNDGGWIALITSLLVNEDSTQCCTLICGNCHMHNGLVKKEEFPGTVYYCPHCHVMNRGSKPKYSDDRGDDSSACITSDAMGGKVTDSKAIPQEQPVGSQ